jgi:hypothetical protein
LEKNGEGHLHKEAKENNYCGEMPRIGGRMQLL